VEVQKECIAFGMTEEAKCSSASGVGRRQFIGRKECVFFFRAGQGWDGTLYQNTRLIRDVPYLTNYHIRYHSSLSLVCRGKTLYEIEQVGLQAPACSLWKWCCTACRSEAAFASSCSLNFANDHTTFKRGAQLHASRLSKRFSCATFM
jgi:hypothetical protein